MKIKLLAMMAFLSIGLSQPMEAWSWMQVNTDGLRVEFSRTLIRLFLRRYTRKEVR